MKEQDLKKLFDQKLGAADFEFNPSNWDAFEQMADPQEAMSEQEYKKLFKDKMAQSSFAFNPGNWEAFEQMTNPQEPLSEQAYKKLFRDKLAQLNFPFNPANWDAMEDELGPENGMTGAEMQTLFQKKASQSSFAFNPENWSRMEAILDQKVSKPLAYFWRSAAAILIFAGIAWSMLWQGGSPNLNLPIEAELVNQAPKASDQDLLKGSPNSSEAPSKETLQERQIEESALSSNSVPTSNSVQATIPPIDQGPSSPRTRSAAPNQSGLALANDSEFANSTIEGPSDLEQAQQNIYSAIQLPTKEIQAWNTFTSLVPGSLKDLNFDPSPFVKNKDLYVPQAYSKLYLLAGPAFSAPMNGKMGSPGWQLGLEYEYGWNEKSALSTGVIYNRSGDIGLETVHDSTFFGLGRTDIQTHRHYKSLSSIRIPLNYRYNFAPKQSFGFGLNTDILVSVRMDQTKTTQVFKQDPRVEEQAFNQMMESFEPVNFSAHFSYQYQYSPRLSFAFTYALALNDISRDQAQNFEADHRPGQANLQLRYRLFEE
ncbi:MAG: hypothetical protein NXI09_02000 [Bacteroidetes bacterium]|nr:hypothetical protein [Bacteroidota bacterium]